MADVSWIGVVVAAIASFVIGGLWYSPLMFTRVWQREARVSENVQGRSMAMIFTAAFALQLLGALLLAAFIGVRPGAVERRGVRFSGRPVLRGGCARRELPVRGPQPQALADQWRLQRRHVYHHRRDSRHSIDKTAPGAAGTRPRAALPSWSRRIARADPAER
jgi:hypothetical protein